MSETTTGSGPARPAPAGESRRDQAPAEASAAPGGPAKPPERRLRGWPILLAILLFAAALVLLALRGIAGRQQTTQETQRVADRAAALTVRVVSPERAPTAVQIDLPGQAQAYTQAPIFAQTNGYLKRWRFDIGAKVKAGDVLAEIETPEVDQQLAQARAQLKEAQASLDLSRATYVRYQDLLKNKVVSSQDFDNQSGDYRVKEATFNADDANVRRLEALEAFKEVRAPFDGIVTARNTDTGALINSGSGSPLFTLSQVTPLRVYVNVPESLARYVRENDPADVTLGSFPDRHSPGKVVRTAGAIDPVSRTLLTEIQVPNEKGELFPGAYAQVHLRTQGTPDSFTVPANTLLFRAEGAAVGLVKPDDTVEIRKIRIRRDLGGKLEVAEGLSLNDRIVVNPSDGLEQGMKVVVEDPHRKQ